jgi:NOL1/NOP2/sun family putative RNA methylase
MELGYIADFQEFSPGALMEHMLGHYYVQGVPSMTVVEVLDPKPDEVVMDLASAPGGKTTHIGQRMNNTGMVVSIENDRKRIQSLESNIQRCGVTNSIVIRADARKLEEIDIEPDRILLDAPCSGEGLIAIDPTRKTSKSMADIRYCATREGDMLEAAVEKLRVRGVLVYATCSIAPEENEFVVDNVLRNHPEMKIEPITQDFGSPGYSQPYDVQLNESLTMAKRFLPHKDGTEGFFICRMRKVGAS